MTSKKKDPLWPAVPSRIIVDGSPLLAQVSGMMEDAQSMEALRHSHSCLRDRVIAGMARKNNVPQERGRKRGRRCGTASSVLERAYSPAVVTGRIGGGLAQQPRCRKTTVGPAGGGRRVTDRKKDAGRLGAGIESSRQVTTAGLRSGRGMPATRSEPSFTLLQSPHSDASFGGFTSFGGGSSGGEEDSHLPTSRVVESSRHKVQHFEHHPDHFSSQRRLRGTAASAVASARNTLKPGGSAGGGATIPNPDPRALAFDPDIASLPGVCHITYPPTLDLAAVDSSSLLNGGVGGTGALMREERITRSARVRRDDDSFAGVQRRAEERSKSTESHQKGEEAGMEGESSDLPRGVEFTGTRRGSSTEENDTSAELSLGRSGREGSGNCKAFPDPTPRLSPESSLLSADPLSHSRGLARQGDNLEAERVESSTEGSSHNRNKSGGGGESSNGRRRRRCRNSVLSMMTKAGHPLVASNESPSLPGVDEHQPSSFWLAEMLDNMRKNRLRMATDVETDLTMVVRYFMRFGAKRGRDELTLQDLEAAFRASRRADAFVAIEKRGKEAFAKCLAMLETHGLTPEAWSEELLSGKRDSFTTFDMGESIRGYNREKPSWVRSHKQWLRQYMISEKDLRWCQRFVDPDGNTDIDAKELSNAVHATLHGKPRLAREESRAVELILEFEKFISAHRIRLVDLFEKVDKDKGGTIDEDELREFLLLGRERLTGVYDLIESLKTFVKTKGLRLSDMVQATGAHFDEGMDPSQLVAFFERATNSSLRFTEESLEKIVQMADEDGDGLLSLSEIQLVLTQHTQDERLLRRLAKAVAHHIAGKENAAIQHHRNKNPWVSDGSGGGGSSSSSRVLDDLSGHPSAKMFVRDSGRAAQWSSSYDEESSEITMSVNAPLYSGASKAVPGGASINADDNYNWILDDESSIDGITAMDGIELSASTRERRAMFYMDSSVPRTAFKVQAGSNLDSSWLPGFDQRFEFQRLAQGQRVDGGSCTWYTN
ncbi:unnamed protein product [Pylaiella littoralis]